MIKTFDFPVYYNVQIDDETGFVKIFSNSKHAKGRELSQFLSPHGYLKVKMNNKGYEIHRIVAHFFHGERPNGLCVNHKDGNKLNNKPSNLEYVTLAENTRHSAKMGMHVCSDPKRSGRYIDGRAVDVPKYKHEWYLKNREKILKKVKDRYQASKRNASTLTAK